MAEGISNANLKFKTLNQEKRVQLWPMMSVLVIPLRLSHQPRAHISQVSCIPKIKQISIQYIFR